MDALVVFQSRSIVPVFHLFAVVMSAATYCLYIHIAVCKAGKYIHCVHIDWVHLLWSRSKSTPLCCGHTSTAVERIALHE